MLKRIIQAGVFAVLLMAMPCLGERSAAEGVSAGTQDPLVLVFQKSTHKLTVYEEGKAVKGYVAVFGVNPDGDKVRQGDNRTPEGVYYITDKERLGEHPYLGRKWFGLSYPNVEHAERALNKSLITYAEYAEIINACNAQALPPQNTMLGGWIGIHGGREDLTKQGIDWTEGCIAMLDSDLEELFKVVTPGTKVVITK